MRLRNSDLAAAKSTLEEKNLALAIVKKGKIIFESDSHGILSLLRVIENLGDRLVNCSVADRIVGAAAASLFTYSKIDSVFAVTISEEGIRVLETNNVPFFFRKKVPNILNNSRTGICPFEKLALGSGSPKEAYLKLKIFAENCDKRAIDGDACRC